MNFISYKVGALSRWPDNELACYLAGRLAWDASQDDRALIDEFFRLYFQEAAGPMRAYYRLLNLVGRQTDSAAARCAARSGRRKLPCGSR